MLKDNKPYSIENGDIDDKLLKDLRKDEQEEAIHYIKDSFIKSNKILRGCTSYRLKHYLEGATNIYMTNNQFKDLMLICGFKTDNVNELNWEFNISKRSPALKGEEYQYSAHNPKFYKENQYPMG